MMKWRRMKRVPKGLWKLAGGASHRITHQLILPRQGQRTFPAPPPGCVRVLIYSGGLRHRLISVVPSGRAEAP